MGRDVSTASKFCETRQQNIAHTALSIAYLQISAPYRIGTWRSEQLSYFSAINYNTTFDLRQTDYNF